MDAPFAALPGYPNLRNLSLTATVLDLRGRPDLNTNPNPDPHRIPHWQSERLWISHPHHDPATPSRIGSYGLVQGAPRDEKTNLGPD